jgi:hypothetical protein
LKIGSAIFSFILVVIGIVLIPMVIWIVLNNYMMQNPEYIITNNLKKRKYSANQPSDEDAAYRYCG